MTTPPRLSFPSLRSCEGPFLVVLGLLLALPAASRADEEVPGAPVDGGGAIEPEGEHDPLLGMDPSGRIPKVELPGSIPNPERWRYIPEGRIIEGHFFERFLVSSFISPVFFFESDVGAGGGVGITDFDFRGQRRREFAGAFAYYTTEGQQAVAMTWKRWLYHQDLEEELPGGGVALEERSFVKGRIGYTRTLTTRFFGLGSDTDEDDETSYIDEEFRVGLGFELAVPRAGDAPVIGLGLNYQHHSLGPGNIDSEPTTDAIFPVLFEEGDRHDSFWVTGGIRYDTRDSQHNPYDGYAVGVTFSAAPLQSHWDAGGLVHVFATAVQSVPPLFHDGGDDSEEHPPTDVVAVSVFVDDTVGNLPFWALPSLGGSETLRGYIRNRWTGSTAWHAATEYRFWIIPRGYAFTDTIRIERFGMALFVEAGSVGRRLEQVWDEDIQLSYGVGFRASFERTALLRADLGFSEEGVNFSVGFGTSF